MKMCLLVTEDTNLTDGWTDGHPVQWHRLSSKIMIPVSEKSTHQYL